MKKNKLFKKISAILNAIVFISSLSVLIGWIFDLPFLRNIFSGFIAMKPNTSLCFVLISLSIWLFQEEYFKTRLKNIVFYFCVSVIFLLSLLAFCEHLFNRNLGIDLILIKNLNTAMLTDLHTRMAFNSSINFILLSFILVITNYKKAVFAYLAQILSLFIALSALFLFICYLYNAGYPHLGIFSRNPIASHSTLLFILVTLSYLFAQPDKGIMKNVSSEYFGSFILRRILPVVIFVPLTLGWLRAYAEKKDLFSCELGIALVAVLNLLAISIFVYILAIYLNRLDVKRRKMELMLKDSKNKLERQTRLAAEHLKEMERNRLIMVSMLEDNNVIRKRLEESLKELKYAQEMALQAEKLKAIGQLASGIAHEVKNPLGIISEGINYLKRKVSSKEKSSFKALSMMKSSLDRADKIINELLDFSKINKLDLKRLNINSVIESSINLAQAGVKLGTIHIVKELEKEIPEVLVDKNKMEQVFINLLLNASQAMDYHGTVTIRTYLQKLKEENKTGLGKDEIIFKAGQNAVIIEIEDTGIGIPEENLKKVFEPFFSTKGPRQGAGLGLGVCLSIVSLHKGLINIASKIGKGTKVTIILKPA